MPFAFGGGGVVVDIKIMKTWSDPFGVTCECADQRRLDIKLLCEQDGFLPCNQAASGAFCCWGGGVDSRLES